MIDMKAEDAAAAGEAARQALAQMHCFVRRGGGTLDRTCVMDVFRRYVEHMRLLCGPPGLLDAMPAHRQLLAAAIGAASLASRFHNDAEEAKAAAKAAAPPPRAASTGTAPSTTSSTGSPYGSPGSSA